MEPPPGRRRLPTGLKWGGAHPTPPLAHTRCGPPRKSIQRFRESIISPEEWAETSHSSSENGISQIPISGIALMVPASRTLIGRFG